MKYFPVFLSLVFVVRNCSSELEKLLTETTALLSSFVKDYELIIVDNASRDMSVSVLKRLTGEEGLYNLRVYALAKEVDIYTASWVGIENALGDFVAVVDPFIEDIHFLPEMLNEATMKEADVVFVQNQQKPNQGVVYRIADSIFNIVYRYFHGIHLATEAPQFRLLNKRVTHFILQHPQPAVAYQYLPATAGFSCVKLSYSAPPSVVPSKRLGDSIDRGIQLLVSTSRAPLRIVTGLSLCGAILNLIYSIYVVVIFFFKPHVATGWASLSLQQSGMFFLISLVLYALGEYILHVASVSSERPLYNISQEFTSVHIGYRDKLNIESQYIRKEI